MGRLQGRLCREVLLRTRASILDGMAGIWELDPPLAPDPNGNPRASVLVSGRRAAVHNGLCRGLGPKACLFRFLQLLDSKEPG